MFNFEEVVGFATCERGKDVVLDCKGFAVGQGNFPDGMISGFRYLIDRYDGLVWELFEEELVDGFGHGSAY